MSQNFGTPIDLRGNIIKNAGLDVVSALPTTFLVEGREIIFQGEVFRYLNGKWHLNSFSAYSLKTYAELKALKDNNALVVGNQYVLTDFYTTYLAEDGKTWLGAPDCEVIDHLGNPIVSDNYHILLQATSEKTFSPQAYIFNQPDSDKPYLKRMSEWIIYFDLDLDLFGRIYYMYDTVYNNEFDFDIFNIRWGWKGFEIDRYLLSTDTTLYGKINPNDTYYLWTIGDSEGPYECKFSFYEQYPTNLYGYVHGVKGVRILRSSKIFMYIYAGTATSTTANIKWHRANNISIYECNNIATFWESHDFEMSFCSNLFLANEPSFFCMYSAHSILDIGLYSRGLNLGVREGFNESCRYLTFNFPGSAYVRHEIFLAGYCTFLAKKCAPTLIQPYNYGYPMMYFSTIINRNTLGNGGTNSTLNFSEFQDNEFTFSSPNSNTSVYAFSPNEFIGRKISTPNDITTSPGTHHVFELETCENNTFLNYTNTNNEKVRTSLQDVEIIDSFSVSFYDEFISKKNRTYFLPFGVFYDYPNAWGYEIESVKYPTNTIFPVLCCFFCNSGTNTTTFAGKRLKFYVDYGNETFYSSEYTINSNGTLTKVS